MNGKKVNVDAICKCIGILITETNTTAVSDWKQLFESLPHVILFDECEPGEVISGCIPQTISEVEDESSEYSISFILFDNFTAGFTGEGIEGSFTSWMDALLYFIKHEITILQAPQLPKEFKNIIK